MPITSVRELREHIELAIQVELTTVPPYLYALHSIADQTSEAALLIRSIVVEEMLHAALATNLLLAIGGEPRFGTTEWIPRYPELLPHHTPPLPIGLRPASIEVVRDVFMRIEQPEVHGAQPEPDVFETLGQFYHALEEALRELSATIDLFADPQLERQMGDVAYYGPVEYDAADSGGLVAVTDLDTAFEAIEVIVHQGEGLSTERWADPAHQELTHYSKLLDIAEGTSPLGAIRPVPTDPSVEDYPDDVREVADCFNAVYRYAFLLMDRVFSGGPDQGAQVGALYTCMAGVLAPLAEYLVTLPTPGGVAAPTFEVWEFGDDPDGELRAMAGDLRSAHPGLDAPLVLLDTMCG
jgi:hypothetical protein